MPIKLAAPHTPQWYADRYTGFGASDMAGAIGLSERRTQPLTIYKRKRRELIDTEETEAMEAGRFMEPSIRDWYCHRTATTLLDPHPPMYRHSEYSYLLATPDGIIDEKRLLECKNASEYMKGEYGEQGTDSVPVEYFVQCQSQMCVMDTSSVQLAAVIGGNKLRIYDVLRNDELIDLMIRVAGELWQRIMDGKPPEPKWTHPSTPALIKSLHTTVNDTRILLTDEEAFYWSEYERIGKEIQILQERRDAFKARVVYAIGDHGAGVLHDGRMVRRKWIETKPYTVTKEPYIDIRAVKADGGRIIERIEHVEDPPLAITTEMARLCQEGN